MCMDYETVSSIVCISIIIAGSIDAPIVGVFSGDAIFNINISHYFVWWDDTTVMCILQ